METTRLFAPLWQQLWWVFPLLIGVALLQSPWFKGLLGEWQVKTKSRRKLPADTYHAFHDVTLVDDTGSTQIDHLFVSPYGLFVVETKNYKGWIFGSAHSAQWTQTTGRYKHRFQNPLRQNYRHTMALSQLLSIGHEHIHSLIVFTGDAQFKTPLPNNVCTLSHFDRYILSFRDVIWSAQEVQRICQAIATKRLAQGRATNAAHRQHLRQRHGRGRPNA